MTDNSLPAKVDRPPLPRDAFRARRTGTAISEAASTEPVVVTPSYDDLVEPAQRHPGAARSAQPQPLRPARPPDRHERNPFQAYGERTSSRPYALRLPDTIDLVVRQMAAEQRTHPLRIVDRALYDHLKQLGRLPPLSKS